MRGKNPEMVSSLLFMTENKCFLIRICGKIIAEKYSMLTDPCLLFEWIPEQGMHFSAVRDRMVFLVLLMTTEFVRKNGKII